ncbi:MAG: DNA repair protein RecO [Holophagaceae bacterium]|jgi:DNA repair protein RecO
MSDTFHALILKPMAYRDNETLVSFITEQGTRGSGIAKGTKRPTARWISSFEPLNLVTISLFGKENQSLKRITSCELISSPMLLGHLESNLVISCLADLFDRITHEGLEDPRLFRLLKTVTEGLKARPEEAASILAYAEFWVLYLLGWLPDPKTCGHCQGTAEPFTMLSDERGWLCRHCHPVGEGEGLPRGTKEYLNHLKSETPLSLQSQNLNSQIFPVIARVLRQRLLREMGSSPKSYEVLFRASGL